MRSVRLYPASHGYTLDQPEFARLLGETVKRDLLVQIVLRMEDERVDHAAIAMSAVDVAPYSRSSGALELPLYVPGAYAPGYCMSGLRPYRRCGTIDVSHSAAASSVKLIVTIYRH